MSNLIVPRNYTETDAVNYCLRAIGEAPIANAATATQADVIEILGHLQTVTAEVLARRWQFNTEIGYHLAPIGQLDWVSPITGNVETLNVFAPLAGGTSGTTMVSFRVTPTYAQSGPQNVSAGIRLSNDYENGDDEPVVIFYDRIKNREGWLASAYPYLVLDVVWYMDFVNMPYEAQAYVVTQAARRTVEQSVNSSEIANFIKTDEAQRYRDLTRRWQLDDDYNALRTVNAFRTYGNRPATNVGFIDIRGYQQPIITTVGATLQATVTPASVAATQAHGFAYQATFTVGNPNTSLQLIALLVDSDNTVCQNPQIFSVDGSVQPSGTTGANLQVPALGSVQVVLAYTVHTTGTGFAEIEAELNGSVNGVVNVTGT